MGVEDLPWIEVTSRGQWRDWLTNHHTQESGIWLVTYKKHRGSQHIPWTDLVQECLCFGWIDSRRKGVDGDRTRMMVTPRNKGGNWSAVNKGHVVELERLGLMQPAGRARIEEAQQDGSWSFLDDIEALVVPDDLDEALSAAGLREGWNALSRSDRKLLLYSIKVAKRTATRRRRIEAAMTQTRAQIDPIDGSDG